jgi:hypothetical protein
VEDLAVHVLVLNEERPDDERKVVRLHDLGQAVGLRETQLDLLPVAVYEPDPPPVVIMIPVNKRRLPWEADRT